MNASEYKDVERFRVGPVEFISKAKKCGKENCAACPHKGYWYAQIGAYECEKHGRREIYLGRMWAADDLKKKIAPVLREGLRVQFLEMINQQLRREDLARLLDEMHRLESEGKRLQALYKQQIGSNQRGVAEVKGRISRLQKVVAREGKTGAAGR